MSRKRAVDLKVFPHTYTGPNTRWGLESGEPCRIIGSAAAGGKRIVTPDGKRWIVGGLEVARAAPAG